MFSWLWTSFWDLPWWGSILVFVYALYFIVRAIMIYRETSEEGLVKGSRNIFLGENPQYLRLYHILRMIADIPPLVLGIFFPLIRWIFTLKLYKFKPQETTK